MPELDERRAESPNAHVRPSITRTDSPTSAPSGSVGGGGGGGGGSPEPLLAWAGAVAPCSPGTTAIPSTSVSTSLPDESGTLLVAASSVAESNRCERPSASSTKAPVTTAAINTTAAIEPTSHPVVRVDRADGSWVTANRKASSTAPRRVPREDRRAALGSRPHVVLLSTQSEGRCCCPRAPRR